MNYKIKKLEFPHIDKNMSSADATVEQKNDEVNYLASVICEIMNMKVLDDLTDSDDTYGNMLRLGFNDDPNNIPKLAVFYSRHNSYKYCLCVVLCREDGIVESQTPNNNTAYVMVINRGNSNYNYHLKYFVNKLGDVFLYDIVDSMDFNTSYNNAINKTSDLLLKTKIDDEFNIFRIQSSGSYTAVSQKISNSFYNSSSLLRETFNYYYRLLNFNNGERYLTDAYTFLNIGSNYYQHALNNMKCVLDPNLSINFGNEIIINGEHYMSVSYSSGLQVYYLVSLEEE